MTFTGVLISLVPALALMGFLIWMDGYKLAPPRAVLLSMAGGAAAAGAALVVNRAVVNSSAIPLSDYVRWIAPLMEEVLKAAFLWWLIARNRIGFQIDALIHGAAVGAGFALIENGYFLWNVAGSTLSVLAARGMGTAMMHAAAGSITAMLALRFYRTRPWPYVLVGVAAAVVLHGLYNRAMISPLIAALVMCAAGPALVLMAFEQGTKAARRWLNLGFDEDAQLLEQLKAGSLSGTRVGDYVEALRLRFPPQTAADLLSLLQVNLELSLRAKGIMLARAQGFRVDTDEQVRANLSELAYLKQSVGRTAYAAARPLLGKSHRELWELYRLDQQP